MTKGKQMILEQHDGEHQVLGAAVVGHFELPL